MDKVELEKPKMTQQEYTKELRRINESISFLQKGRLELGRTHIESNRIFNNGDKVKIQYRDVEHIGFIASVGIHDDGELYYRVVKAKKDGAPSLIRLYYDSQSIITKI